MATPSAAKLQHEHDMKGELYGIDLSFTGLASIAVICRFWARHRSAGNYGWDDWLVLVSLFVVFANLALNIVMIEHGLGLQAADVPLPSLMTIGKAIYGDEIVYVVVLAMVKVAILVMYCRVFPLRRFRVASWVIGGITVIWSLMFIFICIFQCSPIPRAWNPTIPGSCLNLRAIFIGNAVPNIATDVAILMMPMYHVWRLQVRKAQRIALTAIFLLGAFVIFASIYRFTTILNLNPANLSYTLKTPTTWSHVEVCVALISACLPVMRPLLTAFLGVIGLNKSSRNGKTSEYNNRAGGTALPQLSKKKPNSEFSVLDEGRDGWSMPTKIGSNDELPLTGIQVQKEYEQKVETSSESKSWLDDRTRKTVVPFAV